MPNPKDEQQSHMNYDVLIQLRDSVGVGFARFDKFTSDQGIENKLLHARIDSSQKEFLGTVNNLNEKMAVTVNSLNEKMVARGRITPAYVAIVVSLITLFSGAGAAYVGMMLSPMEKIILQNSAHITSAEVQRKMLSKDLQSVAVATAVADAESKKDREWIIKLQDELRHPSSND